MVRRVPEHRYDLYVLADHGQVLCQSFREITGRRLERWIRSPDGPVCFWRGKRHQLGDDDPGPFSGRPDAGLVLDGVADLMAMPSAGDLVIYGIDAPDAHVSFIPEHGAHAGPSPEEMQTFVVRPPHVSVPVPLRHPVQLYEHFVRYAHPDGDGR